MEKRVYRGNITAEELADHLVQHYDPKPNLQAQKIGKDESFLVQIGYGDTPADIRHALTVAIAKTEDGSGVSVAMGQRQWITPDEAKHAAFWGLLAVLVTPWVLFALIWPLGEAISSTSLPGDIWSLVDTYAVSHGASMSYSEPLSHPHVA